MNRERNFFLKKKIGVLYGGWSSEREISIGSGKTVIKALKRQGFDVRGIDVDRNFVKKLKGIDVAFIALHGKPGEDGTIQGALELLQIPYTGSGVLGSAIGMDKVVSKYLFTVNEIPTPDFYFEKNIDINELIIKLDFPMVMKPRADGSSVGVTIIETKTELLKAIKKAARKFKELLFEKYIAGMNATCGVINDVPLPVLEIAPKKRKFYDYKSKYTEGMTEYIVPARIPPEQYKQLQEYALAAHRAICASGFSRVDFVLDENYNPYVLEVNTIPGLLPGSNLPLEARAIGITYDELVFEILKTSLPRFKKKR
ncbi:MAG TPA: D-alanine--D-alanine ligase [candidate division WOR-3 bacterium]|uniref:D-alanine--D-alanine ligase n=1 Tax=candidate division WOR-3 bacterium TaxID=2052148 RepID=A0A9C9EKH4_UNCW3|nr:D-alanine--D-alanine ligase [candidate division WOR-3 bacterium]